MTDLDKKKLDTILRHINLVRDNCIVLGERLIEKGNTEIGLRLIANGQIHDNSKFSGIEWLYLNSETKENNLDLFELAVAHHAQHNPHHPEFYLGGIKTMPAEYVAEMSVDWVSRSQQFGDDVFSWIDKSLVRYKYSKKTSVYHSIKQFIDTLLEPSFN